MFKQGPDFCFEISKVEITRVSCNNNNKITYFYLFTDCWNLVRLLSGASNQKGV